MEIDEISRKYPVLEKVVNRIKEVDKINQLFPTQEKAVNSGYLDGKDLVLAVPTSAGKTLVSELLMLKVILEKKKKAIYTAPLKALVMEKYKKFKEKYEPLGIKVAVATGDLDRDEGWIGNFDIILTSNEKLDSLIRHRPLWLDSLGAVVIDEVHLLNDSSRGPTLEIVITLLKRLVKDCQFIYLSATIGNHKELASWLDAEVVYDEWRPVKLYEGIFYNNEIDFLEEKENKKVNGKSDPAVELALDTIKMEKQALVFVNNKKSAEALAERISDLVKVNDEKLLELSKNILGAIDHPTEQCRRLGNIVKKGIAFHHSGLVAKQRGLIEDKFKEGKIKIICCTPSLAQGVDMPAFRAIIKDLRRFSLGGMNWIPTLEYKQQAGRAGRPSYDNFGEAISIATNERDRDLIIERYINGELEEITSRLSSRSILRIYTLSLVASDFCNSIEELIDFFRDTFYGFLYNIKSVERLIYEAVELLEHYNFIKEINNRLEATLIGKRVSELYIDPESAYLMINSFKELKDARDISYTHVINQCIEARPLLNVKNSEYEEVNSEMIKFDDNLFFNDDEELNLSAFKTSMVFNEWMNEITDEMIMERYGVRPGELRTRLEIADWLLYSYGELSRLLEYDNIKRDVDKLRTRMSYGIKEELLNLIKLRGIGRVRSRMLFNKGIKNVNDVKNTDVRILAEIVGKNVALDIKKQVGERQEENKINESLVGYKVK